MSSFGVKMVPFLSDCVLRTEGYLYVVRSRRQAVLCNGHVLSTLPFQQRRTIGTRSCQAQLWSSLGSLPTQETLNSHGRHTPHCPRSCLPRVLHSGGSDAQWHRSGTIQGLVSVDTYREFAAWRSLGPYLYFGAQCLGGCCYSPGRHFGSTITAVSLRPR